MRGSPRDLRRRLPVRVRLVAGFTVAMAVLLCAAGSFVYWRVRIDLDAELARELDLATAAVEPLVDPRGVVASTETSAAVRLHQTLTATGAVRSSGTDAGSGALLTPAQAARASRRPQTIDLGAFLSGRGRALRLRATPLAGRGDTTVLVVAVRRDQRDEALRELLVQLAIAGALALALAALIGERLAKAALSPVESYRRQAQHLARHADGSRLAVRTDIDDEITRLGHTFNDVLDAQEQAAARERRFLDDASHELRTPLARLRARVQLLQRRDRTVDEYERGLADLRADIDDLILLTDDLLALGAVSRVAGSAPPRLLAEVIGPELLTQLGRRAEDLPNVDLAVASDDLRRVLTNLLSNAEVHGAPPVFCEFSVQGDRLVIEVRDHGAGIAADFLPDAFGRFRRGPESQNRPGHGLGLAIVAELVQRSGGALHLCSRGAHTTVGSSVGIACAHGVPGTSVLVELPVVLHRTE